MKASHENIECWVNAAHASECNNKTASPDPNSARSRMGYVINYTGCPMHWTSKMQTFHNRSRVHSTFTLPITWLREETKHLGITALNAKLKVLCKVFEDNAGAIEIANLPQ
jgi:hypothetical protein